MTANLSVYVLTSNSERRLEQVLDAAAKISDEIVIIDSGSTDRTKEIAERFDAKFFYRKFDNFCGQRVYAESLCSNDWVLALDSDEVLSEKLIASIANLKQRLFNNNVAGAPDGFSIRRDWYFLGKKVNTFYPVIAPDFVVRLFNKQRISTKGSRIIHESLQIGNSSIDTIDEPIMHFSCDSIDQLYEKIDLYTKLSAQDMHQNGIQSSWIKINVFPWLIWVKWYFINGAWKDGGRGKILCKYARDTVYLKYIKLKHYSQYP